MGPELARYAASQIAKVIAAAFIVAFIGGGFIAWLLFA
jgi:hypothetical protein